MTQILWEIVCQFLVKLNICLSYDPGIPLLNIFSREIRRVTTQKLAYECSQQL